MITEKVHNGINGGDHVNFKWAENYFACYTHFLTFILLCKFEHSSVKQGSLVFT